MSNLERKLDSGQFVVTAELRKGQGGGDRNLRGQQGVPGFLGGAGAGLERLQRLRGPPLHPERDRSRSQGRARRRSPER